MLLSGCGTCQGKIPHGLWVAEGGTLGLRGEGMLRRDGRPPLPPQQGSGGGKKSRRFSAIPENQPYPFLFLIFQMYILSGEALRIRFVCIFSFSVHGWLRFTLMYFVEPKLVKKPTDAE